MAGHDERVAGFEKGYLTDRDGDPAIVVRGSLAFESNRVFHDSCPSSPAGESLTLDLTAAQCIYSTGHGMLIPVRDRAGVTPAAVTLRGANPTQKTILGLANVGRLFAINRISRQRVRLRPYSAATRYASAMVG